MKSWKEKLASAKPHQVKPVAKSFAGMKQGQSMLIPSARMIDAFIRGIPSGSCLDLKTLREKLAAEHNAEITCPIATGFLLRIVSEAAWEDHETGTPLSKITPVWRVLDAMSPTLKKISFDPQFILDQRQKEGLTP